MFKILIFTVFFVVSNVVYAANNSAFIVNNIPVYAKSDNAQKARNIALNEGQRKALKTLFQKGGIDPDYTKFISDDMVSEMVESIKVDDEIITKNSYSSIVNIVFNSTFVNFNLKKLGIGTNKVTNNYFLYIPVFDQNGEKIADAGNLWYDTTYNEFFLDEEKYKNIVLIDNYDLSNTAISNIKKAKTYSSFSTLLSKYNANTIIIATARYLKNKDVVEIEFEEIDAENTDKRILNFSNKNGLSEHDLIVEASKKTLEFLNNESRDRIAAAQKDDSNIKKKNNYLDVFYVIKNLSEYAYMLSLLENIDFINKYDTLQLTTKIANLRLHYSCDESELIPLLNNKGFVINTKYRKNFMEYEGF